MRIFPDRFRIEYLEFLLAQLDIDNLIASADYEPVDDESRRKNKKCITINFCGLAANTLLGNEIGIGSDNVGSAELRTKIKNAFMFLFEKDTLKKFDDLNIYLRVRFCFSYLYSDFPACLVKAENPENWKYTGEGVKYGFHYTKPITETQLKSSKIYSSQQSSLRKIYSIIEQRPELLIRDGVKEKHFIQVRFAVVPSPICILIINKVLCCDSYLYAKFPQKHEGLSLHYPISIVEKKDNSQFESISKHFNYLWRHDLTLFCGDGTEFAMNNLEGLMVIKSPKNIDWYDKETRVRNSQRRNMGEHVKFVEKEINKWKEDLTYKLKLSTSKVILINKLSLLARLGKIYSWIISIVIFSMLTFLLTLFLDRSTYNHIMEWLMEHSLFSILIAVVSIISFSVERFSKIIKER